MLRKIQHTSLLGPKRICYYSISLKLMVPFLQCKLINDRKETMKEEKGKQVEAGEMEERKGKTRKLLSTKGGHRCAAQKACIGFSRVHTCTNAHTRTLSVLPLRFNTGADASQWSIRLTLSCQHSRVERDRERERWMGNNLVRGSGREKVFSRQWWRSERKIES